MPNRRKVLIGIGVSVALAGCSGGEGTSTQSPTDSPTETPKPAHFTVEDMQPKNQIITSEEIELSATIANDGEVVATKEAEIVFQDDVVSSEDISLKPGEETTINTTVNGYDLEYQVYSYKIRTEDSTHEWTFSTYTDQAVQPMFIPEYTIENEKKMDTGNRTTLEYDILVDKGITDLSKDGLLNLCRLLILKAIRVTDIESIQLLFWREDQRIGEESAQAVVNWEPTDSTTAGDYSRYEFSLDGLMYLEVADIDGPDEVEVDEEFSVTWTIANNGFADIEFDGWVQKFDDIFASFDIELPMGETATVTITDTLNYSGQDGYYTIHGRKVHGYTEKKVEAK